MIHVRKLMFAVFCLSITACGGSSEPGYQPSPLPDGSWVVISREGTPAAPAGTKIIVTPQKITLNEGGVDKVLGEISSIMPGKQPAQINLKNGEDISLGIFELTGDDMKLQIADPGQPRPAAFKGYGKAPLYVLKRNR